MGFWFCLETHDYGHDRIISFLVFLKNFIFIDNEEINRTFDRHILQLTGGTVNRGVIDIVKRQERQQGALQGAERKSYEVVHNLIQNTEFDDAKIASLAAVAVSFVREVRSTLEKKK